MRIEVRPRGEVEVVDIIAETAGSAGEGEPSLIERLEHLLGAGQTLFILNLTRGPALDGAWLGQLMVCRKLVQGHRGTIKLVVTPRQFRAIAAGNLASEIEVFQDEEDALDSCVPWYATNGIP